MRYARTLRFALLLVTLTALAIWSLVAGYSIDDGPSCPLIHHLTYKPLPRPPFRVTPADDEYPDIVVPDRPKVGSRFMLDNGRD